MMIGYRLAREYNSLETKMRRNSAVIDNQEIGLEQVVKRIKKKKKEKIIDKYNGKSDLLVWNCKGDQCNAIGYEQVSAQI